MAILKNKNELVEEIGSSYQKLQTDLSNVPEELTKTKSMEGLGQAHIDLLVPIVSLTQSALTDLSLSSTEATERIARAPVRPP